MRTKYSAATIIRTERFSDYSKETTSEAQKERDDKEPCPICKDGGIRKVLIRDGRPLWCCKKCFWSYFEALECDKSRILFTTSSFEELIKLLRIYRGCEGELHGEKNRKSGKAGLS